MTKYSTGSDRGGGDGDACELCGRETGNLERANVAGANLLVCSNCAPHGDAGGRSSGSGRGGGSGSGSGASSGSRDADEPSRKKRAAQNVARAMDASSGDSSRWEREGTDYEKDRLPYLVKGYGDVVTEARQDEELTVDELAAEVGVDDTHIHAVEEGRAARAGVGGSTIRALEQRLDVTLVDE